MLLFPHRLPVMCKMNSSRFAIFHFHKETYQTKQLPNHSFCWYITNSAGSHITEFHTWWTMRRGIPPPQHIWPDSSRHSQTLWAVGSSRWASNKASSVWATPTQQSTPGNRWAVKQRYWWGWTSGDSSPPHLGMEWQLFRLSGCTRRDRMQDVEGNAKTFFFFVILP